MVLLREVRARGYSGGYTILKEYVQPRRRRRQPRATVRFETGPGEQAQVDWGRLSYITEDGRKRRVWAFVMVLSWSRALYVEFVRRADVATFMRFHVNAFEYFGSVPRRCLYDNAKVVVLGRDDAGRPEWNSRMLDFALRVGFEMRLCRPYRAQTKGKIESGVKYVRRNLWPTSGCMGRRCSGRRRYSRRSEGTCWSCRSVPVWRRPFERGGRWDATDTCIGLGWPAVMGNQGGSPWRSRCRQARWSDGPWRRTNWRLVEVCDDRPGAGAAVHGEPGVD